MADTGLHSEGGNACLDRFQIKPIDFLGYKCYK